MKPLLRNALLCVGVVALIYATYLTAVQHERAAEADPQPFMEQTR